MSNLFGRTLREAPAELWQQAGRWDEIGPELVRFRDRSGRDMVLGMTHEEVITFLTRQEINSYRFVRVSVDPRML